MARQTDTRPVVAFVSSSCTNGPGVACTGNETYSISTAAYKVSTRV
jgi:hypothetical protein